MIVWKIKTRESTGTLSPESLTKSLGRIDLLTSVNGKQSRYGGSI